MILPTPLQTIRAFISVAIIVYALIYIPCDSLKYTFFEVGGFIELFSVIQSYQVRYAKRTGTPVPEPVLTDRMKSVAMVVAGILVILQYTTSTVSAAALNESAIGSGAYTQQNTLYLWLVAAALVFIMSIALAILQRGSSIISVMLNFFSAGIVLYCGYLYTNGQLISNPFSAVNPVSGNIVMQSNVILDSSASTVLFILGLILFVVFVLQAVDFYESMDKRDDDEYLETFT